MADHKIDGNHGAGNVQAPERIWASNRTNGICVVSFTSRSEEYSIEYIRADVAASQIAAANARADAAWDALRNIAELNKTARDENGHVWDKSDLIAQEIHSALRAKPACDTKTAENATQPGLCDTSDPQTAPVVTVQEAAKVLLDAFMRKDIDPLDAVDPQIEALAIKHSGNRGDPVIQLEIAEEFFCAALRSIAPPEA